MKLNKLDKKLHELNSIIDFIDLNILEKGLKNRYIKVLRHQKALIRDIDRKGRKIPENIPYVCELSGVEVGSIREKEPPYKLKSDIKLSYHTTEGVLSGHNSYSHILNNYSIKSMRKLLDRKIGFDDLSDIKDNITLIMEVFKHKDYYKKYIDINSFVKQLDNITSVVDGM
jgi:hypothetical protein